MVSLLRQVSTLLHYINKSTVAQSPREDALYDRHEHLFGKKKKAGRSRNCYHADEGQLKEIQRGKAAKYKFLKRKIMLPQKELTLFITNLLFSLHSLIKPLLCVITVVFPCHLSLSFQIFHSFITFA